MSIKYFVQVDQRYQHLYQSFRWWIKSVLSAKKRSSITTITGVKYQEVGFDEDASIIAKLVPQSKINKVCGFEQLSCSLISNDPAKPDEILFSYENWMGGSHFEGSVEAYRKYLINHEFLHCRPFYLDHPKDEEMTNLCVDKRKLPVMYQQSRGRVGNCIHNSWPLKDELL